MLSYTIRFVPAFTHLGVDYRESYHLVLRCSRGFRWDGGEYTTRAEAIAIGERRIARKAA